MPAPVRRTTRLAALLASAALGLTAVGAAPPAAAAPYCGITWGSTPDVRQYAEGDRGDLVGVRAGRHECFDRLVLDLTGEATGYQLQYRRRVRSDGSGTPVPVSGGARLQVTVNRGVTSVPTLPSVAGFTTFRGVAWGGSFEGYTTLALGVRARLPMRAFLLRDPETDTSRLVVDVAHHW